MTSHPVTVPILSTHANNGRPDNLVRTCAEDFKKAVYCKFYWKILLAKNKTKRKRSPDHTAHASLIRAFAVRIGAEDHFSLTKPIDANCLFYSGSAHFQTSTDDDDDDDGD